MLFHSTNNSKRFSKHLHRQSDNKGRKAVKAYLTSQNIIAIDNPNECGVDLLLPNENYNVEVEIKKIWKDSYFPFASVQLPYRKQKYTEGTKPTVFFILRKDCKEAFTFPSTVLADLTPVEVPNKYVTSGELFFQVPVSLGKFIGLTIEGGVK